MDENRQKILIYGGNGFVGTHVAELLIRRGISVSCASRSGRRPIHLANSTWADSVQWLESDAANADASFLSGFDAMISTIGSAPLPTFSKVAYEKQFSNNGTSNVNAIESATQAGIKRLVLIGAKIPKFLQRERFAYAKGKRVALEAARVFSAHSDEHRATVIQPGGIFGTRHASNGTKIPLTLLMGPLSKVIGSQLVAVERLTECIVDAALRPSNTLPAFQLIKHSQI